MLDSPNLDLTVRRFRRRVVVVVEGDLDAYTSPLLRYCLQDLVEAQGNLFVDLDVSLVTFVDGSGLGVLVRNHRALARAGGTFTLVDVPDALRRALEVTGLIDVFTIRASRYDDPPDDYTGASAASASASNAASASTHASTAALASSPPGAAK